MAKNPVVSIIVTNAFEQNPENDSLYILNEQNHRIGDRKSLLEYTLPDLDWQERTWKLEIVRMMPSIAKLSGTEREQKIEAAYEKLSGGRKGGMPVFTADGVIPVGAFVRENGLKREWCREFPTLETISKLPCVIETHSFTLDRYAALMSQVAKKGETPEVSLARHYGLPEKS